MLQRIFLQSRLDTKCKANYTKDAKRAMHNGGGWVRTKIPELRKERRISQAELADAVGVTRQTITSIEVGKYTASLVLAYKIAKYFGKSIEEIFDFSELEGE
jgi:putative transcriptional regulator